MNRILLHVLGATLLAPAFTNAQVSFGGQPLGLDQAYLPAPPLVVMPEVDANALMVEDEARIASGVKGPYRFGFNHATDISTENSGAWTTLPNGEGV
ncbi:MAG: hypothetical protein IPK70_07610 [Flavobacteriales bacterium]|nr:hypothetical protein [Flavobacteriales bacterium]